jgi:hypothetical protein
MSNRASERHEGTHSHAEPKSTPNGLPDFHKTISQQLNARLAESPRFFWALVAVSTGYGYVLWNYSATPTCSEFKVAWTAAVLSYLSILWASWYLAALGYAFRFLQSAQHSVERELRWSEFAPTASDPPEGIWKPQNIFWLLPSIYHAHAFGLCAFLILVAASYHWLLGGTLAIAIVAAILGLAAIAAINIYYREKFINRQKPQTISIPIGAPKQASHQLPVTDTTTTDAERRDT